VSESFGSKAVVGNGDGLDV